MSKARLPASRRAPTRISVTFEDERWRKDGAVLRLMRRAMRLGLSQREENNSLTLLLSTDARLKALNRDFRGKNKPTNVLSFPSAEPGYLGDIAIAFETVAREAKAQRKPFAQHAAHLALHGVLHLLGHDHEDDIEADVMESLETKLLARLGIASPYLPRPLPRARKAA